MYYITLSLVRFIIESICRLRIINRIITVNYITSRTHLYKNLYKLLPQIKQKLVQFPTIWHLQTIIVWKLASYRCYNQTVVIGHIYITLLSVT